MGLEIAGEGGDTADLTIHTFVSSHLGIRMDK